MKIPTRFISKKQGRDFIVKDVVTGKVAVTAHYDPEQPKLAAKYANFAARVFNEEHAKKLGYRRR
ncbi:MAG TPA: hypothetical protein DCS48_07500 [Desulfovibrio sp.]|nr:hypothetical protein [Desulfovibrio sp.]